MRRGRLTVRCLIVGGGVIGSCVALRLAQRGERVTLVDAAFPGEGTSGSSFAWIGASAPSLGDYFELNEAALAAYRRLRAEIGAAPWLVDRGCLSWSTDPTRQQELAGHIDHLRSNGYSALALLPAQ